MARFNTAPKSTTVKTQNLAGGDAYKHDARYELVSLLLTSFLKDKFYESANEQLARLQRLVAEADPMFAAKAALYARRDNAMRSVSHVVAGEIFRLPTPDAKTNRVSGQSWVQRFLDKVVIRPDDATEILSYYENVAIEPSRKKTKANGFTQPTPKQLIKGLALSLAKFDEYQLAKYKGEGKMIGLIDLLNYTHPEHRAEYEKAIKGTLKSSDTWETKISEAGRVASEGKTEEQVLEEKSANKKEAWNELITSKKISYFALLRNLRNIIEQAPEVLDEALELLVDENRIAKSRVLPFRFITAMEEIGKVGKPAEARKVIKALDVATNIACKSAPRFDGKTLVVLDTSGSMNGQPKLIGSLFAAILAKSNEADVIVFGSSAEYVNYNPLDSVTTIQNQLNRYGLGGTNHDTPLRIIGDTAYDRMIWLSDEQGWQGNGTPVRLLNDYRQRVGKHTKVYSFDLQGHGTTQFDPNDVHKIAGFSDKALSMIEFLEQDKNAIIREIESITI